MRVDIWSDIVCPWCAIGRARFEAALKQFEHRDDVTVRWRSFELDPTAPAQRPESLNAHLAHKYGVSLDEAASMHDHMTAMAAAEGLTFRFDIARPGNTFDAHRLLHLAADHNRQYALKERLQTAYLAEGQPMGDGDTLVALAAEVGLDERDVATVLDGDRYADAVRADEDQARAYGITGVPFFVIDDTYGVSGAQPPDVLHEALVRASSERRPTSAARR